LKQRHKGKKRPAQSDLDNGSQSDGSVHSVTSSIASIIGAVLQKSSKVKALRRAADDLEAAALEIDDGEVSDGSRGPRNELLAFFSVPRAVAIKGAMKWEFICKMDACN